jgi:hypothetical protein
LAVENETDARAVVFDENSIWEARMAIHTPPKAAADEGLGRVDRGQRVAGEAQLVQGHDGKQRAIFVRRKEGELPPDTAGIDGATPVTVESVVESPPSASAWEALEDDDG